MSSRLEHFFPSPSSIWMRVQNIFKFSITRLAIFSTGVWGIRSFCHFLVTNIYPPIAPEVTRSIITYIDEPTYKCLVECLRRLPTFQTVRHLMVTTEQKVAQAPNLRAIQDAAGTEEDGDVTESPVQFSIGPGLHRIMYEDHLLFVTRSPRLSTNGDDKPTEFIKVECLGDGMEALQNLFKSIHDKFLADDNSDHLRIFTPSIDQWKLRSEQPWSEAFYLHRRPMHTMSIDPQIMQAILKQISDFRKPEACRQCIDAGIPYRLGYLFYGPPGTGKTSFVKAIASHFQMDIYEIDPGMEGLTGPTFRKLFRTLPRQSIVLMEDPDGMEIFNQTSTSGTNNRNNSVSKADFLNALDGMLAQEGQIVFLNTNHPDRLGDAVLRAGRFDHKVKFKNITAEGAKEMFERLYAGADHTSSDFEQMATAFAKHIPDMRFSPAQIQAFLLQHRADPKIAYAEIEAWVRNQGKTTGSSEDHMSTAKMLDLVEEHNYDAKPSSEAGSEYADCEETLGDQK